MRIYQRRKNERFSYIVETDQYRDCSVDGREKRRAKTNIDTRSYSSRVSREKNKKKEDEINWQYPGISNGKSILHECILAYVNTDLSHYLVLPFCASSCAFANGRTNLAWVARIQ